MIGEFGEVYVLDWGLAAALQPEVHAWLPRVSECNAPAGTPAYMAPEMVLGDGSQLSARTDVYLLGAILYEILTGSPPHTGKTLREVMFAAFRSEPPPLPDSVPRALGAICRRAMAHVPADRFASTDELRVALVDFRRHRVALTLAEEAANRLDVLRAMIDENAEDARTDSEIYKVFGECRFGFVQALRMDKTEEARSGLQAVLELMADRELSRSAYHAASLIIAEFPEERPGFEQRLEKLGSLIASRGIEFESLQKFKHGGDPDIGRESRGLLSRVLGAVFGLIWLIFHFLWSAGKIEITSGLLLLHGLSLVLVIAAIRRFGGRWLLQNSSSRRMMLGLHIMVIGALGYRLITWLVGIPALQALPGEIMFYGVGASVLGLAQDRRLTSAGISYLVGGLAAALLPNYVMLCFAATNLVALWSLAFSLQKSLNDAPEGTASIPAEADAHAPPVRRVT